MATSSSAKKVARVAAKSGSGRPAGTAESNSRNWLFALGIVAIVLLGAGIVFVARDKNGGALDNTKKPRANLQNGEPYDHWHAAFAIEVCGKELAALQDGPTDVMGIHTHGDGLIHIHPFTRTASGERANLGKFWKQVSLTVTDEGFELPKGVTVEGKGSTVKEGVTTCGGKPGELVLAEWKDAKTAAKNPPDKIYRSNFADVNFKNDYSAYTLAFVPKGSTDINPPSSAANIEQLGSADSGGSSSGGSSTATVPTGSGSGTPSNGTGG
ncbi:MAG: hypothetical protein U0P45_01710 [Acidimicrobiales bacterium]